MLVVVYNIFSVLKNLEILVDIVRFDEILNKDVCVKSFF